MSELKPKERVLLLMPKTSYRADDFLAAAERLGIEIQIGSDRCRTLSRHWGVPLALSYRDAPKAAAEIVAHARQLGFSAILPTDDRGTEIACLAADQLGLRTNPPAAAYAARDKSVMRERLRAASVPCPDFAVLSAGESTAKGVELAEALGWPVVVKPLLMSGSRGVIRADRAPALVDAIERVWSILHSRDVEPSTNPAAGHVLIERFVTGDEYSVEGLLGEDGFRCLAIFDKPDPLDGPFFEESIYVTPSRLPKSAQVQLATEAERAARALGLVAGPVHAELRLHKGEVTVIEVAGRSIGGLCSRTLELGTGFSLEEIILMDAVGRQLPATDLRAGSSGVIMLPIPKRGLLREVQGIEAASAVPGVTAVEITAPLDHEIVPLPEGSSYLGFVFARGDDPGEVESALRKAHRELRAVITDPLLAP